MPSLHISNVSYALLERQRVTLATITADQLNKEQMSALEGIQNMLDTWSDEEYFILKSGFRKER
tara:strand:+ start:25 stop:216 length:192 start_codon:yes stop_codon:yes gene_type:complete